VKFPWFNKSPENSAIKILTSGGWQCGTCHQTHSGMFDLAAFAPDHWNGDEHYEPNSALQLEGNFLSEDFCVLNGEHFFVRCVIEIPVIGMKERFGFGCWGSLSKSNFEMYVAQFDVGIDSDNEVWSSWLCNRFYDYIDEEPTACWMTPKAKRQRPRLTIQNQDNPLAIDQKNGIQPENVLAIYAHYGHQVKQ
jgi:hypothetical protein